MLARLPLSLRDIYDRMFGGLGRTYNDCIVYLDEHTFQTFIEIDAIGTGIKGIIDRYIPKSIILNNSIRRNQAAYAEKDRGQSDIAVLGRINGIDNFRYAEARGFSVLQVLIYGSIYVCQISLSLYVFWRNF